MFNIHTQTHKLISNHLYKHIKDSYDIELNYEKLTWGSIAPDILPKYKLYRHYYENSIDYIILKIAKLIFVNRFIDLSNCNYLTLKMFSRDLGIISHYLSDFTCLAHADRWEMPKSLVKHVKYEKELNEYSKTHVFKSPEVNKVSIDIDTSEIFKQLPKIKLFIESVIYEYLQERSFQRDLDFALYLNKAVFGFVIESIQEYNDEKHFAYSY